MSNNNPYLNRNAFGGVQKNNDSVKAGVVATNLGIRPVLQTVSNPTPEPETNHSNSYKTTYNNQAALMSLTQGEMLIKLYDEIVIQLNIGIESIDITRDIIKRNNSLQKAQKIFNHLRMSLNFDYEISNNLYSLYDFFVRCVIEANVKDDSKPLIDILPLIIDLKDSYTEAEKSLKNNKK